MTNLIELFDDKCIIAKSQAENKQELLSQIANCASKNPSLSSFTSNEILKSLETREKLGSTGLGGSIALPHCRLPGINKFIIGLLTTNKMIDFNSLDGEKINLAIFIIAPEDMPKEHINILSRISSFINNKQIFEKLTEADSVKEITKILKYGLADNSKISHEKNIFHIFSMREDYIKKILQTMHSRGQSNATIIEGKSTQEYLLTSPLFRGFWNDNIEESMFIVIAIIDKIHSTEIINNIEKITGPLNQCSNTMMLIQDVPYVAGSLG